MKKLKLIFLLCLGISSVYAGKYDKPSIEVLSKITFDTLGIAKFQVKSHNTKGFNAITPKLESVNYNLQNNGWQAINDSMQIINLSLIYNSRNLPYYPEKLTLIIPFINENVDTIYVKEILWVYFTPYGETEIWNNLDFYNLPRSWYLTGNSNHPARRFIEKINIPSSDLPENYKAIYTQDEIIEMNIEGLAYAIKKKTPKTT